MKADCQPRRHLTRLQEVALWAMFLGSVAMVLAWWGSIVYLLAVA